MTVKVLITGSGGYLGGALVEYLNSTGKYFIYELVRNKRHENQVCCNLLDTTSVRNLAAKFSPDLIIHSAAFVPSSFEDYSNVMLTSTNARMMSNLLDNFNCPMIYVSSMTVYGPSSIILRNENDAGSPETAYGESKWLCENLLKKANCDALAVRIPGLFGAGRQSGLVENTIKSMRIRKFPVLPAQPIIWAAMHVEDAARAISGLIEQNWHGFHAINIAYDEIYSVNRLVAMCEAVFNYHIDYDVMHPDFAFDLALAERFSVLPHNRLNDYIV